MRRLPRRLLRVLGRHLEWLAWVALAATALVLAYWGFENQPAEPGTTRSPLDSFYRSLQLIWLEYGSSSEPTSWQLDTARLLAAAVLPLLAVLAVVAIFRERIGIALTRRSRVVVCGLGRKGLLLARAFRARGCHVVVVEQDEQNTAIERCRAEGIPVLVGDATDPAVLRQARVRRARYVIAVCGSDGTNADIAAHARELVGKDSRGEPLAAFVHVVDLELCRLLRDRLVSEESRGSFRLELFNVFESGARAWLREHPPFGEPGEKLDRPPHLLVVGVGQMGMSLVVGAARQWLTFQSGSGLRPRITILDREAERKKESLLLRYPQLAEICELVSFTTDVTWPEFGEGKFLRGSDGRPDVTSLYVCLDDDARGVTAALALHELVCQERVPIVVRTAEAGGLAAAVQGFENVRIFPLLDRTCTPEMLVGETPAETLARGVHDEYVRHERAAGHTARSNPSLVDWHLLPESLKESNRRQADHVAIKLRAVGCGLGPATDGNAEHVVFSPEEVEILARLEHDRWMAERLFEGWTYAQPPKDLVKKTSPDLVDWDELGEDGKRKDRDTVRDLPALLAAAGFQVYRLTDSADGSQSSR